MKKIKFSLAYKDPSLVKLVKKTEHKKLAVWAIDCARRVLPYFEEKYPEDKRPQKALESLQTWIKTGVFKMAVTRKAALDSHAAAREVNEDNAARSAARAAGQAVATAHVKTHSLAAANYVLQAIYRNTYSLTAVKRERQWQYQRLRDLKRRKLSIK